MENELLITKIKCGEWIVNSIEEKLRKYIIIGVNFRIVKQVVI